MVNKDLARLQHMLDCAQAIITFSKNRNREDLDSDRFFASAIMREFEVIGEAATAISIETRNRFSQIHWKQIIGMRNTLIHAYFDVDHNIVWSTIKEALPDLINNIEFVILELQKE